MAAKWEAKAIETVREITRKLEEIKHTHPDGMAFKGIEFADYEVILLSHLELNPAIPEVEKRRMLRDALFTCGPKGTITADALLQYICRLEHEYLRQPEQRFVLHTYLSIEREQFAANLQVNGSRIKLDPSPRNEFSLRSIALLKEAKERLWAEPPSDYSACRVFTSAKSAHAAGDNALDALDLIRGIWNLRLNGNSWLRFSSGKRKPVNPIVLGPIHTLHKPSGELAADVWWYEPHYCGPIKPHRLKKGDIDGLLLFTKKAKARLKAIPYREELEAWFVRYARALDEHDWTNSFVRLWSLLEAVTFTDGASYDVTKRRAAIIWSEGEYHRRVLEHLRKFRNAVVHSAADSEYVETLLYQLKRYVDALLRFHLNAGPTFNSKDEVVEFLDLPPSIDVLSQQIRLRNKALKFLAPAQD